VLGEDIPVTQGAPTYTLGTSALLVGPAAGSNSVVLDVVPSIALWSATANASWLHMASGYTSGTGSANVLFTYDANAGVTRSGTLTIGGQTLTVTQAGSTYVQAPGPLTAVVSNDVGQVVGTAVDASGNVYISDVGSNLVKKWSVANNTITTLIASNQLDTPQSIAVDTAGNVYVADFYGASIKEWVAASSTVISVVSNGLENPSGLAVDNLGNLYISDPSLDAVLEWTAANSNLATLVSSGLTAPYGVAVDAAYNVYIADTDTNTIWKWNATTHAVTALVTNGISTPWNVGVDVSGNVYVANGGTDTIRKWNAYSGVVSSLTTPGLSTPTAVALDGSQNVYIADYGYNEVKELPYAFVDPTPKTEGKTAGSDVLPTVLFPTENLLRPFAPTVNQPWLSIGSISSGVVHFNFTANGTTASRTGDIILLGESIAVTQTGVVPPPKLINAKMLTNGVFQFGFTNANLNATFSVLFSTNVTTPLTNWTVIGTASNISPGVLQFTDLHATNMTRFYMVSSP
jgi:streptogramin lyase